MDLCGRSCMKEGLVREGPSGGGVVCEGRVL